MTFPDAAPHAAFVAWRRLYALSFLLFTASGIAFGYRVCVGARLKLEAIAAQPEQFTRQIDDIMRQMLGPPSSDQ